MLIKCSFIGHVFRISSNRYEYRWADGVTIKKPIVVSAQKYVDYLMDWIEAQLEDEAIFPQKLGKYSACCRSGIALLIKTMLKHLLLGCRKSISTKLSGCCEDNIEAAVSCLCPYLPFTFPDNCESARRSPSQHLLQAFCALYIGKAIDPISIILPFHLPCLEHRHKI